MVGKPNGVNKVPLEPSKLKQNAVTSIRLGVEDFQRSRLEKKEGGDPDRAISSARNLFAGLLLLFKYRLILSIKDPQDIHKVIYKPPKEVVPYPDGKGGIDWTPTGKFQTKTTIDVEDIKKRFTAFKINVDWDLMQRLQTERNNLEHLHPTQNAGAIAGFVADLFPMLRAFIVEELDDSPATLLGAAWAIMLEHHDFFIEEQQACRLMWSESSIPERLKDLTDAIMCEGCGSPLVQPDPDSVEHYKCVACDFQAEVFGQLEEELEKACGGYNPFHGDDAPTDTCPECEHQLFVVSEGECYWCDYELEDRECTICEEPLGLDDRHTGGLCSYHYYVWNKDD